MLTRRSFIATGIASTSCLAMPCQGFAADAPKGFECLGMISIRSGLYEKYLQSYAGGDVHCSNPKRNTEETWFLWNIDSDKKNVFAITNYDRADRFLSVNDKGCVECKPLLVTDKEKWELVSGKDFGVANAVAFRNVGNRFFMGSAKDNLGGCDGEVGCGWGSLHKAPPGSPPSNEPMFPGWWIVKAEGKPEKGGPSIGEVLGKAVKVVAVAAKVIAAIY